MNTRKAAMRVVSICLKVAIFVLIVLGIVYLGQRTFRYAHAVFSDTAMEAPPGRSVKIRIAEEVTAKKMAEFLEKKGVIENAETFRIQMKYHEFEGMIKPGIYELNTSMPPSEIIRILSGEQKEDDT